MTRRVLGVAAGWVVLVGGVVQGQSPAEVKLQGLGLERSGGTFVHSSERPALDKVEELKGAYNRLMTARYKLAEVDGNTEVIAMLNQQAAYLKQEQNAINNQARGMRLPRGARMMVNQTINAERQQEQMAINNVNGEIAARKKMAPTPQARKALEDDVTKRKTEAVDIVTEARKLVDEAHAAYEGLAKDANVKTSLDAVKKTTTDAIKLGPSKDFLAAAKAVAAAERLLGVKTEAPAGETPRRGHAPRSSLKAKRAASAN